MAELSGPLWVKRFPNSVSVADLAEPFQSKAARFLAALEQAQASVEIASTYRPVERAFLMHYAWDISELKFDPREVPAHDGIDIDWVHRTAAGQPDLTASRKAAAQMVEAYEIAHRPALNSEHTHRRAIDMDISWKGTLAIVDAHGEEYQIGSKPRTGSNEDLIEVGASYGVIKLRSDPPHWSTDGH